MDLTQKSNKGNCEVVRSLHLADRRTQEIWRGLFSFDSLILLPFRIFNDHKYLVMENRP